MGDKTRNIHKWEESVNESYSHGWDVQQQSEEYEKWKNEYAQYGHGEHEHEHDEDDEHEDNHSAENESECSKHHFEIPQPVCNLTPVLNELARIIAALIDIVVNPNFGLKEIKTEVFAIEQAVKSPTFGLAEIKTEIFQIQKNLGGFTFGSVPTQILNLLTSPTFGLAEIKTEVFQIERLLKSSTFGLAEIKTELFQAVEALTSPTFGLAEIKTEVFQLEKMMKSPTHGLAEIKTEVFQIERLLKSSTFGLAEIKTEVFQLEKKMGVHCERLTTGPVLREVRNAAQDLLAKVLNHSGSPVTVTLNVLDLTCGPAVVVATQAAVIPPETVFDFSIRNVPVASLREYEVQLSGIKPCVFVFSSFTNGGINPSNTFRHSQFVPACCP